MKTYEKPTVTLVTLAANTSFCFNCSMDIDNLLPVFPGYFAQDNCDKQPPGYEEYCKFTAVTGIVYNS